MELYGEGLQFLKQCSNLVIAAIIKKTWPSKDDITERQAKERYGTKWIHSRKRSKAIETHRNGRWIVYSIHEIECVLAAEKDYEKDFMRIYRPEGGE